MKIIFKKFNLLFISICSLIILTSCGCSTILDFYSNVDVNIINPNNGNISILTDGNPTNLRGGDNLYIRTIPNDGYKLTSLIVNGVDASDDPYIKINKSKYEISATFEPFNEVNNTNNYVISDNSTTYLDIYNSQGYGITPSIGDINILVVPVEFNDYEPFSAYQLEAINKAFNGENSDYSNSYWESVKSYYLKSSYNKLNFNFDITDVISSPISGDEFTFKENLSDGRGSLKLLNYIYQNLTINNRQVDYSNYDNNNDGYIDGVWLIYNANNYNEVYNNQEFWAYTYVIENTPNITNPTFCRYANASQIFLYADNNFGLDAHTLIHETGHMLGLDDYYTYDELETPISATGGLDMMDLNIGDHNSFSKFSLGWINPLVINGETSITLKPFNESGEALILKGSNTSLNSPFNEYFIVEYYTPNNLFTLDCSSHYRENYPRYYDYNGLRIYHIDSRLISPKGEYYSSDYFNLDRPIETNEEFMTLGRIVSSSNTYSRSNNGEFLIEQVTPFDIKTYQNSYLGYLNSYRGEIEVIPGLFTSGDVFNFKAQPTFFNNSNKLHNKDSFNFSLRVESISETGANLTIKVL